MISELSDSDSRVRRILSSSSERSSSIQVFMLPFLLRSLLYLRGFERITKLEVIIQKNLHPVSSCRFKLDVHKEFNAGGVGFLVREPDFDVFSFDQDRVSVRFQNAAALGELSAATAPAIDPLKTERLDHSSHESVVPDTVLPSAQNEARVGLER